MAYKVINKFPKYIIYDNGVVMSIKKNKVKKQLVDKYGYMYVKLWDNAHSKNVKVHRLVAEAFIENKFNKIAVNHKDCNKKNNDVSNLEWVTTQENNQHAIDNGLIEYLKIIKGKAVIDLHTGIFYNSLKEACIANNCEYSASIKRINRNSKNKRFDFIHCTIPCTFEGKYTRYKEQL